MEVPGISVAHNTPKGLLKGSKLTRSHTTVIEAAIPAVSAAKESPRVFKIVIGVIFHADSSRVADAGEG